MSDITLNPYLFFKGNAKEVMEHYKSIFGGTLDTMSYEQAKLDGPTGDNTWLIHADLYDGDVHLMASDTAKANDKAAKVTISLFGEDEAKLRTIFEKLSEGVTTDYPLTKAFWGDINGSVTDKFGVDWMITITAQK